ncbi:putative nuclease HARBI1 [Magallana gigas]|uniref:putative nuclease HARBI1 n=1 Tax=Magallana gigas TaxID=29159 RepID=UPI00333EADF0
MLSSTLLIKKKRQRNARITNYAEAILPMYRMVDLRDRFQMNRHTFESLVIKLAPYLARGVKDGCIKINVEKQLLIYVKYVSTQITLQTIADIFGVCEATVFNLVKRISSVICSELMPLHIKWPTGHRVQRTINEFQQLKGFPGVLGATDGSHIPIRSPTEHQENYINRKGFHSIILQAVCDAKMHFLDVYCGWPGSVHDSRVLKNSSLYALANTKKNYNYIHSSTRMSIERLFGSLKGRSRRLKFVDMLDMERSISVILSSCTLHEFCLDNSDSGEEYNTEGERDEEEINNFQYAFGVPLSAELKRESISVLLNQ